MRDPPVVPEHGHVPIEPGQPELLEHGVVRSRGEGPDPSVRVQEVAEGRDGSQGNGK